MISANYNNFTLQEEISDVFERHLDSLIGDLEYLQEIMAITELADGLKKQFKGKMDKLELFGVEFYSSTSLKL